MNAKGTNRGKQRVMQSEREKENPDMLQVSTRTTEIRCSQDGGRMRDAETVVKHLRGLKYDARVENGGIVVLSPKKLRMGQRERLRNELRAMGYCGKLVRRVTK